MFTPEPRENTACPEPRCLGWMMRPLKGAGMAAAIKSQLEPRRENLGVREKKEPKPRGTRGCNIGGKTHFPFEPVQRLVTHPDRKSYYWGP